MQTIRLKLALVLLPAALVLMNACSGSTVTSSSLQASATTGLSASTSPAPVNTPSLSASTGEAPITEPALELESTETAAIPATCALTPSDMLGPFYTPGAPERDSVGTGYLLTGVVRSGSDCSPVAGAQIDFWLAGPQGEYGDEWRAITFSAADGSYRFESHAPPGYSGRPPHIHILVSAAGFNTLVTQHYPEPGSTQAEFDLVLSPAQ